MEHMKSEFIPYSRSLLDVNCRPTTSQITFHSTLNVARNRSKNVKAQKVFKQASKRSVAEAGGNNN